MEEEPGEALREASIVNAFYPSVFPKKSIHDFKNALNEWIMAEGDWGIRDSRGEWQPDVLPKPGSLFSRPWKPLDILKYLFAPEGFFWPYNLFYALLAVISWLWFTPGLARTARFEVGGFSISTLSTG